VPGRYHKPDLLVIDDMTTWACLPKLSGEYLLEVILRRHRGQGHVHDLEPAALEDWGKLVGDVPSATAILDRSLHHADEIDTTGRSDRAQGQGHPGPNRPGPARTGPNRPGPARTDPAETSAQ